MHKKSIFLVILGCIFLLQQLGASVEPNVDQYVKHAIDSYEFSITGNTKENLVRRKIVPVAGDPVFNSIEAMEAALDKKKETLFNLRVFTSVEYEYELTKSENDTAYYKVRFLIDDAFTFLPIPYPKYDSNYGFRLGLKVYDKNLFGTFADFYLFGHMTQSNNSWASMSMGSEFYLKNLPLGQSMLNFSGTVAAVKDSLGIRVNSYLGAITWVGIPIFSTKINLAGYIDEDKVPYGSISWQGFKVGPSNISVSSSISEARVITNTLSWSAIPVGKTTMSLQPVVNVTRKTDLSWYVNQTKLTTSFGRIPVFSVPFAFSNTLTLNLPSKRLDTSTKVTLLDAKIAGHPVSPYFSISDIYEIPNDIFRDHKLTLGISTSFKLPFNITYAPSLATSILLDSTTVLNHVPVLSTTQNLTANSVNWRNNIRHGFEGSIKINGEYAFFPNATGIEATSLTLSAEVSLNAFAAFGKRLGLSARFLGYTSYIPSYDSTGMKFTYFMPSSKLAPSEELRGILNRTFNDIANTGTAVNRKLGVVMNLDATLMFVKFDNFAEGFISLFFDVGLFTKSAAVPNNIITFDDILLFKSIGIEGYGILDRFRSYPIRASVGFNLDYLAEHLRGERAFMETLEITMGMGLLY